MSFLRSWVVIGALYIMGCATGMPLPESLRHGGIEPPVHADLESAVAPAPTAAMTVEPAPAAAAATEPALVPAPKPVQAAPPVIAPHEPASTSTPALAAAPTPQVAAPVTNSDDLNMTCDEFFNLLKSTNAATIEAALAAIQKVRPKFLSRAVYAYETNNPYDTASELYPRAIVYGGDAKMVLNFTGGRKSGTYDRLEAMCFNDAKNQFEFFDIVFLQEALSPRRGGDQTDAKDLSDEEKKLTQLVIPGGRGVRECARCHQSPSRPIWDTSALWPGFYGAIGDALHDSQKEDERPIYGKLERMGWAAFQNVRVKNKRYALVTQELTRANADFTLKLSYLNGRRIVEELKRKGAAFEGHKYEFARALFCAPKAEHRDLGGEAAADVLPLGSDLFTKDIFLDNYEDQMRKEHRLSEILSQKGYPSPLPKEHADHLRLYYRDLFPDKELNLDLRLSSVDVNEVMQMRELQRVTEKIDVPLDEWSMAAAGGYAHENGQGGRAKTAFRLILEKPFTSAFLSGDTELSAAIQEASAAKEAADDGKICGLVDKRLSGHP